MKAFRLDITRTRGDTIPQDIEIALTDGYGEKVSIAGYQFVLVVSTKEAPEDDLSNVGTFTGAVIDEAKDLVRFSGPWENLPAGTLFYEVQSTSPLPNEDKATTTRGRMKIEQDIPKT